MRAVPSGRWCVTWQQRECVCVCHEILFEEPNPTGSRPRGLIGHYRQAPGDREEDTAEGNGRRGSE